MLRVLFRQVRRETTKSITPVADKAIVEADILNGVPEEITKRTVRIYKPAKTAMQSGVAETLYWKLDFDVQQRWNNPLMGWSSSADTQQALRIKFSSKEDAVAFAERQGYDYWVEDPKPEKFVPKAYASNFKVF
ncbi:ETC complex I subunit conserved region-domain-containing protein [Gorgonomyces haynaldii]|nr:ETC complex I subunit conserved region-domain-containing protein [Gorgonomyces haynaldii]